MPIKKWDKNSLNWGKKNSKGISNLQKKGIPVYFFLQGEYDCFAMQMHSKSL